MRPGNRPKWMPWVIIGLIVAIFLVWQAAPTSTHAAGEARLRQLPDPGRRRTTSPSIKYDASSGKITGAFKDGFTQDDGKKEFTTQGQINQLPDADIAAAERSTTSRVNYKPRSSDIARHAARLSACRSCSSARIWFFIARRAQGQMGAVMNIGRSRAKVYNTDKPKTTFADVAGYGAVKEEITEVVDFLKQPGKFKEIGARIPKGVLLVGPPGTGKTLIARAVAGEAGVPFISITGSDFMEMFVGVGAARVRDLFQTAQKQAPAIIFVDEIDSIGRKRGAGLGGGHDEREQTLNQMLAEMDGFEATEGIVMMAATNRPDILDPALLRPGRFDRQIVVPLPTLDERVEILKVHIRDKKIDPDVDVDVVARGTPGMSGADLANLVNEAALFAVRRGAQEVHREDFDAARDRVLMGLKRESLALSEEEKEIIAYHEGGHAVCAYVLEHADPLHKVTILPDRHGARCHAAAARSRSATSTSASTSTTRSSCASAAASPRSSSSATSRPAPRTTSSATPSSPARWCASGACPTASVRWRGARRARCSSARTSCTRATTPTRPPASSTKRSSASCATRKTAAARCSPSTAPGLDAVAKALLERETLGGDEVADIVDTGDGPQGRRTARDHARRRHRGAGRADPPARATATARRTVERRRTRRGRTLRAAARQRRLTRRAT